MLNFPPMQSELESLQGGHTIRSFTLRAPSQTLSRLKGTEVKFRPCEGNL